MQFLIIILFLFTIPRAIALEKINLKLYNYAKACPENSAKNLKSLVDYLYKGGANQTQRVELFCYWIAENISYDTESYVSGKDTDTDNILITKKGVCQNYSELLQRMCSSVKIECHLITGYAKGYGYSKNQIFEETDHAWNIVKTDGKYFFIDATWSSGYVKKINGILTFSKKLNIKELFANPDYFLTRHLPGDPRWQLRDTPATMESFSNNDSINDMLKLTIPNYHYSDSLKTYLVADSMDQKVISAISTYNFNPIDNNLIELADACFNKAWIKSNNNTINTSNIEDYETAIVWYEKSITLYSKLNTPYSTTWTNNARRNIFHCKYRIKALKEKGTNK